MMPGGRQNDLGQNDLGRLSHCGAAGIRAGILGYKNLPPEFPLRRLNLLDTRLHNWPLWREFCGVL